MYKAKGQIKGDSDTSSLSDAVIGYLDKCFSCAFYQNKNNESVLKRALEAIAPMHSGNTHCVTSHEKFPLITCTKASQTGRIFRIFVSHDALLTHGAFVDATLDYVKLKGKS